MNEKRDLELEKFENELVLGLLKKMLALYLIKNSKIPLSELMEELVDAEMQVGKFVSTALHGKGNRDQDFRGILGAVVSTMPLAQFEDK